jgi:membrane protein DedA with SNARE-associated domain
MHPHRRIFLFLAKYKYQVILPIAILEGPVVTVISGILVARGTLSFLPTLAVVFAGDMISDPALYLLGRFGRQLLRRLPLPAFAQHRLEPVERQYAAFPWRTLIVGKLSYGLGSLFVVAAGAARMPARDFLMRMGLVDAVKSASLLALGYFCGRAVLRRTGYLRYYAAAVIAAALLAAAAALIAERRRRTR